MNKILAITTIILAFALIFMCWRSCTKKAVTIQENNIQMEQHQKDSIDLAIDSILAAKNAEKNVLLQKAIIWEYKYDSVIAAQKNIRGLISARELTIQGLLYTLDSVRKDTAVSLVDCRELQGEVYTLLNLTDQLENNIDTANESCQARLEFKDSVINNLQAQLADLRVSFELLTKEYNKAIANERKFVKKVKIADLFTKIATVAAAIISVVTILKK